MFAEWLPSWWTESAVYLYLTGSGRWQVGAYLHASALFLVLAAFARLQQAVARDCQGVRLIALATQALVAFATLFTLCGPGLFMLGAAVWACGAAVFAAVALVLARVLDARWQKRLRQVVRSAA